MKLNPKLHRSCQTPQKFFDLYSVPRQEILQILQKAAPRIYSAHSAEHRLSGDGGGGSGFFGNGGSGGAGIGSAGAIATLTNSDKISGGNGGRGAGPGTFGGSGGAGGAGVSNAGTVTMLTNSGAISGGSGGSGPSGFERQGGFGGAGGAGVSNAQGATIASLSNSGAIGGGNGGSGFYSGGAGGAGVSNAGTITTLSNSGAISGGSGGFGGVRGAAGDAIYSAGKHASIGPITNSGKIIGNVEIDNQSNVTVFGSTGTIFGSWTGGTITIGNGNLSFAGGNTALGDNIVVNDGAGTAFNNDPLMIASPQSITGDFDQSATGALDFGVAGDTAGQYGSLAITGLASLDGGLGLDLTGGFTLAVGDSFDLLTFASLSGDFSGLSLDGAACSARRSDFWACGGFTLQEAIGASTLDLNVLGTSAIPEPSTWALLMTGFLGLAGLRLGRRSTRSSA
jgi:PEP-CTERM motif